MIKRWMSKPYKPFFLISLITLLISFSYLLFYPDSYFDISVHNYFDISSYYAWLAFAVYTLTLGFIYYAAAKNNFKTRRWLLVTHFVFVAIFLILYFLLSSFNTPLVQEFVRGKSFFTVMVAYGSLYILDLITLVSGIILLIANLSSLRRKN